MTSVRATTGAWDPARPTEGAYSALLTFDGRRLRHASPTAATATSTPTSSAAGWARLGRAKDPAAYGAARRALASVDGAAEEAAAKAARNYGGDRLRDGAAGRRRAPWHEHFGLVIVSCERGDLRPTPKGVMVYGDATRELRCRSTPPAVPRAEVIDELCAAVFDGRAPLHDGRWGRATLEVCLAMLESAREQTRGARSSTRWRGIIRHESPRRPPASIPPRKSCGTGARRCPTTASRTS